MTLKFCTKLRGNQKWNPHIFVQKSWVIKKNEQILQNDPHGFGIWMRFE